MNGIIPACTIGLTFPEWADRVYGGSVIVVFSVQSIRLPSLRSAADPSTSQSVHKFHEGTIPHTIFHPKLGK